ncbi:MAG: AMP-binding protein, partial [Flammeovirgaceae bacterium]
MRYKNFNEVIKAASESDKGLVFILGDADRFLSYADLYKNAIRTMGFIQHKTQGQFKEVVFQIDDNEIFITWFIACLLGGFIPVPLSTGQENDCRTKLLSVWKDLSAPCLLIDQKNLERLRLYCNSLGQMDVLSSLEDRIIMSTSGTEYNIPGILMDAMSHDIAFVQYSSGATGSPKGSIVTHKNLLSNASDMIDRARIRPDDRSISWLPLTHDFGLIC